MADMSETFKARLKPDVPPLMAHTKGPCKGQVHTMGPYCERAGCVPAELYTDEEGDE